MRRREFILGLGTATVSPLVARAQQPANLPTIGYLGVNPTIWNDWTKAFVKRLGELGWIDGRTIVLDIRWAQGREDRYFEIASEFVRQKVDIIVTSGTAVPAVKRATSTIPIVFAVSSDPVEGGLVDSIARPGGNATGLSVQAPGVASKRLELLRELCPGLRRLAILANAGFASAVRERDDAASAARELGMEAVPLDIHTADDIEPAVSALHGKAEGLYCCSDAIMVAKHALINSLALRARLPSIYPTGYYLGTEGLMSYGPNVPNMFRRAADFVDKILHGAKPADLPVEQPTKFDFIFNIRVAKMLGLTVPDSFMWRADQVIE